MPKEIAIKIDKETYIKCKKCGAIYVDGCEDYARVGGNEGDYKVIKK